MSPTPRSLAGAVVSVPVVAAAVAAGAAAAGSGALPTPQEASGEERRIVRRGDTVARCDGVVPPAERAAGGSRRDVREFYFARAAYTSGMRSFGWGGERWAIDFPKADRQFLIGVRRLTNLDAYGCENPVRLDDPVVRRYPFLYALEVGGMALTAAEVRGLRSYLEAGGFLVIDDFWGSAEWANFEREMRRVLPDRRIREVPPDHPVFHAFYDIDELRQVPNVGQGMRGGPTWERDGYTPRLRGIFDDDGRLMVAINWNTDLGDAWEWAEHPLYPLEYSTFAYEMGVNLIVYGMSH